MVIQTHNVADTERAGGMLAKKLSPGALVAFTGDLGAGKTAFCRGFLHALGYTGRVTSPTFAIVNEYDTELCRVCHFDMYRILDEDALYDIGWDDYFDGNTILLVEWSENIAGALPEPHITVDIRRGLEENDRMITIDGGSTL
ncbi:tRNA (adenosine(37)-N6)-threonylcarbamoyltransferase complex ATPase subunit type 1 TsaE [Butyricicoccus sp.]|uniref:tRNA (adenosine(37)-N6)-threonylcarbamoyltransferase complex ATPase subunit type 1 TsaE n=1 Tax=Butyricicoccus sp. TaxID=2049021 RepID=UPI0037362A58